MEAIDGYTYRAKRVTASPFDGITQGHYGLTYTTGSIAAGLTAASNIFLFKWTSQTTRCYIQSVRCTGLIASTAFAVGPIVLNLRVIRAWTGTPSGGATTAMTGNLGKLDVNFGSSDSPLILTSTTSALSVGTSTADAGFLGSILTHSSGGFSSATPIIGSLYMPDNTFFRADVASGQSPLIIGYQEGIAIQATVPGTGVWQAGFQVKWAERPLSHP